MGRSKQMGKAVEDLTAEELRAERRRCETLSAIYPAKIATLLKKRLGQIEDRITKLALEEQARGASQPVIDESGP